jgi:two-component system NtrC family sensor kinase
MSSHVSKPFSTSFLMAEATGTWQAQQSHLAALPLRVLRFIRGSLRAKFIIIIVSLQIAVMGAVTLVMERHQRSAILEQARLRALSIGMSLAALSEGYVLSYNFAKLEQAAEKVTADDADVRYAVTHLYDGRVAAFSGRDDLQGKKLDDPVSQRAVQAREPLLQDIAMPRTGEPGYDVAIPVFVPQSSKKWGTIRLGFSLKRAYGLIHQTTRALILLSLGAVLCGTSLAIFLAMRISKPIGELVTGVHAVARGAYGRPIEVNASDEIGYLAQTFEQMRISLQRHLASLADEKRRLEEANRRLQETQQQLIQSERLAAVGQMAARVAHEVNNPLAIIKTAIRIIRHQRQVVDPATEDLQVIEEEIDRIARIIRELLDFARPTPTQDLVQVNTVIRSLEGLLTQNLREREIALHIILEPELPLVRISADQLKQVILNMVRNAEDAMPQGGELTIRTARKGQMVEVGVTDTGCGIAKEHLGRLFDPFFTTKGKERGLGLGLSVSYGLIKGANGNIAVESEVGKGSTFRLSLPAAAGSEGGIRHG